jgi:hypothetical protein
LQAEELNTLVPALIAAAQEACDNPEDAAAQKRLAEALEKLSQPLEDYIDESASPADQAAASADAMSDGVCHTLFNSPSPLLKNYSFFLISSMRSCKQQCAEMYLKSRS